ncbi:MAG: hypothetical protein WCA77_00870, partial [Thermoplasmata archaeon]
MRPGLVGLTAVIALLSVLSGLLPSTTGAYEAGPPARTAEVAAASTPTPTNLTMTGATQNSIQLSWANSTAAGRVGSELWWGLSCSNLNNRQSTGPVETFQIYQLQVATDYCFSVQNLLYHNESTPLEQPFLNVTTLPGYPGKLEVAQASSDTQLDLFWGVLPTSIVNVTLWTGPETCELSRSMSLGTVNSTVVSDLVPNSEYCFGLQYYTSGGGGLLSVETGTTRSSSLVGLQAPKWL